MASKYSRYKTCRHVLARYNIIVAVDGDCPCKMQSGTVLKATCERCEHHETKNAANG